MKKISCIEIRRKIFDGICDLDGTQFFESIILLRITNKQLKSSEYEENYQKTKKKWIRKKIRK